MSEYAVTAPYGSAARRSPQSMLAAFVDNFLGHAPLWYKQTIIGFLAINPVVLAVMGPTVTGWLIIGQFLFTLAMALKCYPLLPGGLLALEAVILGLTDVKAVYDETVHGLPVILLIMFMVAGVYFLRDVLFFALTRIILSIQNRVVLAFTICVSISIFSAFLDALTILAVLVTVSLGFYQVYEAVEKRAGTDVSTVEMEQFRAFLRGMLMHAAVGTAIGGVCTLVGEPENLVIGAVAGWNFPTFFIEVAPVSLPVLAIGLATCLVLEKFRLFSYGAEMPRSVYDVLQQHDADQRSRMTQRDKVMLLSQGVVCAWC
jgi:Na+:H+ antiporter, NhaB family